MVLTTLFTYEKLFPYRFINEISAHKDDFGRYESLVEHSNRTLKKANEIIEKLGLEQILILLNKALYDDLEKFYPKDNKSELTNEEFNSNMQNLLGTLIYLHDLGKVNKQFQFQKLGKSSSGIEGFNDSNHSAIGHSIINQLLFSKSTDTFFRAKDQLGFCGIVLTTIVNRHHTPLLDLTVESKYSSISKSRSIWRSYSKTIQENKIGLENVCRLSVLKNFDEQIEKDNEKIYAHRLDSLGTFPESMFFLYKLWYSILVQADCLSTELFFTNTDSKIGYIDNGLLTEFENNFYSIKSYNKQLSKNERLLNMPLKNLHGINELRTKILLEASKKLTENFSKKIFYLEVPTGGGKTNTSIKLALDLVKNQKLVRINYVFPFVNIIEQNHEEIEATLGQEGKETVSKIYYFSDWGIEKETEEENFNLRNQKFLNYPVNVISNVNFFNIFLKNSKKTTIKVLELCNSVVILDEIQSLPNKKWIYFVTLLNKISKFYNVRFIIMSATLPDLRTLLTESEKKEFDVINLITNPNEYSKHPALKRVTYEIKKKANPDNEVAEITKLCKRLMRERAYKKILVVVNTIADSIEIYKKINEIKGFNVLLLNSATLMHARKEIINKIKSNSKIVLVSTQSVETGIDIDCDVGIRADAPLDSIEQVAGRVNRNGKKSISRSKVFVVPSKSKEYVYSGDIRNKFNISENTGLDCEVLLINRDFGFYYQKIMEGLSQKEEMTRANKFELLDPMDNLEFDKLSHSDYIESRSFSIFLPIKIDGKYFEKYKEIILENDLLKNGHLHGKDVWELYKKAKSTKSMKPAYFKKVQLLMQSFCINLSEPKGYNQAGGFREFIRNSLQYAFEYDEDILVADEKFVKKYFCDFGLDLHMLKLDFKEMKNTNFI